MTQTALLLLDLQNEMVDPAGKVGGGGLAKVVEERGVLRQAASVLDAARQGGIAVAHVRLGFRADYADALSVAPRVARMKEHGAAILGMWGTEFPAAVAPRPEEMVFTKQCVNPFFNTGLMTWLLRRGITRLVIGGVVTNLVVEATARAADDAGFSVVVLEDLCAAPNPAWHRFSVENMLPLFATVTNSDAFLQELAKPALS
jgi:nicotinamidase-related amidase